MEGSVNLDVDIEVKRGLPRRVPRGTLGRRNSLIRLVFPDSSGSQSARHLSEAGMEEKEFGV